MSKKVFELKYFYKYFLSKVGASEDVCNHFFRVFEANRINFLTLSDYMNSSSRKSSLKLKSWIAKALVSNLALLKAVEKNGLNIQVTLENKQKLIHVASEMGKISTVSYLTSKGAKMGNRDDELNPLEIAVKNGYYRLASFFWNRKKTSVKSLESLKALAIMSNNKGLANSIERVLKAKERKKNSKSKKS